MSSLISGPRAAPRARRDAACGDVRSAPAFAATRGRLLPLDGRVGVSLLLTFVIEIMSCFGLAALRAVGDERTREAQSVRETQGRPHIGGDPGIANRDHDRATEMLPQGPSRIIPGASFTAQCRYFIRGSCSAAQSCRMSLECRPYTRTQAQGPSRRGRRNNAPLFDEEGLSEHWQSYP